MIISVSAAELKELAPTDLSDSLERGNIVYFPVSPIPLPEAGDLEFLRTEMPNHLRRKNVSYHPEVDRVVGIHGGREVTERVRDILRRHSRQVAYFLSSALPSLAWRWKVGTSSFRPLQEKGRDLAPHASNERVHIDAGAYGATHGDRILRFFVNANPLEDRVWITKGAFPEVYGRYAEAARIRPPNGGGHDLHERLWNRLYSGTLDLLSRCGLPSAKLADTSPYDRLMRRFHNFMKDTPEFQETLEGHREFSFKPFSAWMVFTDMVTHACVSGQHAFIDTFVIALSNCRLPACAPYHVLSGA
jgi:hypothetical protein